MFISQKTEKASYARKVELKQMPLDLAKNRAKFEL